MMHISKYLPALHFAETHSQASSKLVELAYAILQNGVLPAISTDVLENAKAASVLKDEKEFYSSEILHFFYVLNFTNTISQCQTEKEWFAYFESVNSKLYRHEDEKVKYKLSELVFIISNRIYKINIARFIAGRKPLSSGIAQSFRDILPYINATPEELVEALFIATEGIKAEHNYVDLNQSVMVCSKNNTEFGKLLIQKSRISGEKLQLFFPFAFEGLTVAMGMKEAYPIIEEMLRSSINEHQKVALHALSMLHGENINIQEIEDSVISILEEIETRKDDSLTGSLIFVYGLLINKLSVARNKLIIIPKTNPGPDCFFALSHIIFLKIEEETNAEWLTEGLKVLTNLSNQHVRTYKNLTWAFHSIIETQPSIVFHYFEQFITEEANDLKNIEAFRQIFLDLANDNIRLLEEWLTVWLNKDNGRFHIATENILSLLWVNSIKEIKLHEQTINEFTPTDIEFILFKIVGYVRSKEHQESLVYSALNYKGDIELIEPLVIQLFCFYIIYNYPSSIEYLRKQKPASNNIQQNVIETIEKHYDELHVIKKKKPNELAPSPDRLQLFFNQATKGLLNRENNSPFKEVSLLDLVTKVTIKTGNAFFSRNDSDYSGTKRYTNKSKMGIVSQSFEMPGGEFIDPIGQEYNRFIWRSFKRRIK